MHGLRRTTVLLCAEQQTANAGVLTSLLPCDAGSTPSKHSVTEQGLQSKPRNIFRGQEATGNDFEDQRVFFCVCVGGEDAYPYVHIEEHFFLKN